MMKIFAIIISAVIVSAACLTGCRTIPSQDTIYNAAESIGRAAGYAVELSKTKTEVRTAITQVLDAVSRIVPQTNQTFNTAWKPLIDENVNGLVAAGKLSVEEGDLVKRALYIACDGIDLVFSRYPKAKAYKELVSAATGGFVSGFKSVINFTAGTNLKYDKRAYDVLSVKFKNR